MSIQIFSDCHFHTECSPDSNESLVNHLQAAQSRGVTQLCVTDHWDLIDPPAMLTPPLEEWLTYYQEAQEIVPTATLRRGVELGDGYHNVAHVTSLLQRFPLDFVLGSVHATHKKGGTSIYYGFRDCDTLTKQQEFFIDYFDTLKIQCNHTYFDSLSHIIYPFRYLQSDSPIQLPDYMEHITEILEQLIKNERAFEINTTQGKTLDIWIPVLKRYKDLGGELITLGSDAHNHAHIGLGIPEAIALLQSLGYTAYTSYSKRSPQQIPIV